jgi:hypothetical protein
VDNKVLQVREELVKLAHELVGLVVVKCPRDTVAERAVVALILGQAKGQLANGRLDAQRAFHTRGGVLVNGGAAQVALFLLLKGRDAQVAEVDSHKVEGRRRVAHFLFRGKCFTLVCCCSDFSIPTGPILEGPIQKYFSRPMDFRNYFRKKGASPP